MWFSMAPKGVVQSEVDPVRRLCGIRLSNPYAREPAAGQVYPIHIPKICQTHIDICILFLKAYIGYRPKMSTRSVLFGEHCGSWRFTLFLSPNTMGSARTTLFIFDPSTSPSGIPKRLAMVEWAYATHGCGDPRRNSAPL